MAGAVLVAVAMAVAVAAGATVLLIPALRRQSWAVISRPA